MNNKKINLAFLCHLCLKQTRKLKSIFDKTSDMCISGGEDDLSVADYLSLITNVKIQESKNVPKLMCSQCIKQITNSMAFRRICIKSFQYLDTMHNVIDFVNIEIKKEPEAIVNIVEEPTVSADPLSVSLDDYLNLVVKESLVKEKMNSHAENESNISISTEIKQEDYTRTEHDTTENTVNIINKTEPVTTENTESIEPIKIKIKRPTKPRTKKKPPNSDSHGIIDKDNVKEKKKSPRVKKPRPKSDPVVCMICGQSFRYIHQHIKSHSEERPFECEHCHKCYKTKGLLTCHLRIHSNIRPHKCELCGKGFNDKSSLKCHLVAHAGIRQHECEVCGLKFVQHRNLKKHILTHQQNRRFECTECGKLFLTRTEQRQHTWIHTGEKPYPCKICDKKFRTAGMRRVHELNVHGDIFKKEPKKSLSEVEIKKNLS